jgi:hypothetical protein
MAKLKREIQPANLAAIKQNEFIQAIGMYYNFILMI